MNLPFILNQLIHFRDELSLKMSENSEKKKSLWQLPKVTFSARPFIL